MDANLFSSSKAGSHFLFSDPHLFLYFLFIVGSVAVVVSHHDFCGLKPTANGLLMAKVCQEIDLKIEIPAIQQPGKDIFSFLQHSTIQFPERLHRVAVISGQV